MSHTTITPANTVRTIVWSRVGRPARATSSRATRRASSNLAPSGRARFRRHRYTPMTGRNSATMGRPNPNHPTKLTSRPTKSARKAMARGLAGVPMALPTPPIVAA